MSGWGGGDEMSRVGGTEFNAHDLEFITRLNAMGGMRGTEEPGPSSPVEEEGLLEEQPPPQLPPQGALLPNFGPKYQHFRPISVEEARRRLREVAKEVRPWTLYQTSLGPPRIPHQYHLTVAELKAKDAELADRRKVVAGMSSREVKGSAAAVEVKRGWMMEKEEAMDCDDSYDDQGHFTVSGHVYNNKKKEGGMNIPHPFKDNRGGGKGVRKFKTRTEWGPRTLRKEATLPPPDTSESEIEQGPYRSNTQNKII